MIYVLLAVVNSISIVNMSKIKDKVMKYDYCGTCKMENTENLWVFMTNNLFKDT